MYATRLSSGASKPQMIRPAMANAARIAPARLQRRQEPVRVQTQATRRRSMSPTLPAEDSVEVMQPVMEVALGENNVLPLPVIEEAALLQPSIDIAPPSTLLPEEPAQQESPEPSQQECPTEQHIVIPQDTILELLRMEHAIAREEVAWQASLLVAKTQSAQIELKQHATQYKQLAKVQGCLDAAAKLHAQAKQEADEQYAARLRWEVPAPGAKPRLRRVGISIQETVARVEASLRLVEVGKRVGGAVMGVARMVTGLKSGGSSAPV